MVGAAHTVHPAGMVDDHGLIDAWGDAEAEDQYCGCPDRDAVHASQYVMLDYHVQSWLARHDEAVAVPPP